MSHGILILNEAGGIQVSSDDPCYVQVAAGSVDLASPAIDLPDGVTAPLVFVASAAPVALQQINYADVRQVLLATPAVSGSATYKLFAPVNEVVGPLERYGIAAWDAAGRLTFHSGTAPLAIRFADVRTRGAAGFTLDSGIAAALVCINPFSASKAISSPSYEAPIPLGHTDYYSFCVQTSGSTVTASHQITGDFVGSSDYPDPYDGTPVPILVIAP